MSKMLKHKYKKIGTSPGTLIHIGNFTDTKITVSLTEYDGTHFTETTDINLKDCLIKKEDQRIRWINICGIHDISTVQWIGKFFGLHPLMLEDIVHSDQRAKLDDYKDSIYIVTRLLKYNSTKEEVEDEQISLILGKNYLITFVESATDIFAPIRDRLRTSNSNIRKKKADYLCYSLIDCIVDNYFLILECADQKLEDLEDELLLKPNPHTLLKIQQTKREIIVLRKTLWPVREVISRFNRIETQLIHPSTKLYMQDVYDHTIQAIDIIEGFRDISSGLLDIYMSNLSLSLNEIMKVLTIITTLFVPLTFIASIYGMNFDNIPELHYKWSYPLVLAFMTSIVAIMLLYFRRKKWL